MALPILIRTAEESLQAVPNDYRYRLAAVALGMSRGAGSSAIAQPCRRLTG